MCGQYGMSFKGAVGVFMLAVNYVFCSPAFAINDDETLYTFSSYTLISPLLTVLYTVNDTVQDIKAIDFKIVLQARDDAAAYVGSAGLHRGVFLEAALEMLKANGLQQDEMLLATWILGVDADGQE